MDLKAKAARAGRLYSFGEIGTGVYEFMLAYVLYYLTTVRFMDAGAVGTIMSVGQVVGAIVCVTVGGLIDSLRIKGGSRRAVMMTMFTIVAVLMALIFSPIDFGKIRFVIYLLLYSIYTAGYESFFVSLESLGGVVVTDYEARTKNRTLCTIVNYIGIFIADTLSIYIKNAFVGAGLSDKMAWAVTVWLIAAVCLICVFISWRGTKGFEPVPEKADGGKRPNIFKSYGELLKVKYVRKIAGIGFFAGIAASTITSMLLYFARYVANASENVSATLYTIVVVATIICSFIAPSLGNKIGKKSISIFAYLVFIAISIYLLVSGRATTVEIILLAIGSGIFSGLQYIGVMSMMYDLNELVEYKLGEAKPSAVMGLFNFLAVIGGALCSFITGHVLSATGFDGTLAVQPESAVQGIRLMTTVMPSVLLIVAIIIFATWRMTEAKHDAIVEALAARKEGRAYSEKEFEDLL